MSGRRALVVRGGWEGHHPREPEACAGDESDNFLPHQAGHSLGVLADPNVSAIIRRGLLWASRTGSE